MVLGIADLRTRFTYLSLVEKDGAVVRPSYKIQINLFNEKWYYCTWKTSAHVSLISVQWNTVALSLFHSFMFMLFARHSFMFYLLTFSGRG